MATEKEQVILEFSVEQGDAISELEQMKKVILGLRKDQRELNKAYKEGSITLDEYASETVRIEQILKKETKAYNDLTKQVQGHRSKIDDLIDSNEQLAKSFEESSKNIQIAGISVSDLTEKFSSFLNPVTGTVTALGSLVTLYASSSTGAADYERAQARLNTVMQGFGRELGNLVGSSDGKAGLFNFLVDSFFAATGASASFADIQGQLAANAQRNIKLLEIEAFDAQAYAKDQLKFAEEQRRIRDDQSRSFNERLAAAKAVDVFINNRESELVKFQEKRRAQLLVLLSLDKDNLDLQKELRQIEFEIADIREDSEGKRTEALNGILAIQKEEADQIKKKAEEQRKLNYEVDQYIKKVLESIDAPRRKEEAERRRKQEAESSGESFAQQIGLPSPEQLNRELGDLVKPVERAEEQKRREYQRSAEIYMQLEQEKLNATQAILGNVQSLFDQQSEEYLAFAQAQNIIDTYRAATAALAPPPTGAGPLFGPILAATTVAAGLANAVRIAQSGFAEGGFTGSGFGSPDSSGFKPAGIVHENEYVAPKRVVTNPAAQPHINALERLRLKGYADGGLVTNSSTQEVNTSLIFANALKGLPAPEVSVKEVTKVQRRVQAKENITRR